MAIRRARCRERTDIDRLYEICLRTGDAGADATAHYTDGRLLGEVFVGPYLAHEPDLSFVLDEDHGAIGYVLAARDTVEFATWCEQSWWPRLRTQYPTGTFAAASPDERMTRRIHAPPPVDGPVARRYPAHLHIDLLPCAQGSGNGRALIATVFHALRDLGVPGVHLEVDARNASAVGFYTHLGFRIIRSSPTSLTLGYDLNCSGRDWARGAPGAG